MNRASTRWLPGLVLLACLGPALAFACSPAPQESWTKRSDNGRFTLSIKVPDSGRGRFVSGPVPLTLRNARGKVLWKQEVDYFYGGQALISPSGRYVASVHSGGLVVLYGPKGKRFGEWDLFASLTKLEQERIAMSTCGPMLVGGAAFKGEVLELEALTGGVNRPTENQPAGTLFLLAPETRKLTRVVPQNAPKVPELIERWRALPAGSERAAVLNELLSRAESAAKPGALPELRTLFQELTTQGHKPGERMAGIKGLGLIGTDEELRGLAALPEPELGVEFLTALDARLPREAETYALRVLEAPSPSEYLRETATAYLLGRKEDVVEKGLALALRDASPQVRRSALSALAKKPPSAAMFEQLLSFCQDADSEVRQHAVEHLLHMLEARGPERLALLAVLRRADAEGKLAPFPEGWIILGGLADLEGKHPWALELYARGVKGLSSFLETRSRGTTELLFEGLLQLAIEAKKQNQQDALSRRVHDVLAIPNSQDFYVSAPKPTRYASAEAPPDSRAPAERKSAMLVAKELLLRPESEKPGHHRH